MTSTGRSAHTSATRATNAIDAGARDEATLRLYTAEQAANLLQVSASWLRKNATARKVPCTFVGRYLRFTAADLAAIVHAGARPASSNRLDS
jgi:excisionase family DNA binding protein